MIDRAIATFGRVDVLYNNAGIMPEADHSVIDTDVDTWDQVMAVNVRGVFLGCKYAIPQMVAQGSGSHHQHRELRGPAGLLRAAGRLHRIQGCPPGADPQPGRPVRSDGRPHQRHLPRPVETPLLMDWLLKDEAAKQLRLARNPSGRFGKPEEIVNMAIYLASDESRWTNGASLVVDGGISVNYF